MSTRTGTNGAASIQFTINDAQGEVTNVRLISTQATVSLQFYDELGNVIYDVTLQAPLDQVLNLAPGERPKLINSTHNGVPITSIPYTFTAIGFRASGNQQGQLLDTRSR